MKRPFLLAIRFYQLTFSRLMPNACRFDPTCSWYMHDAIERYGVPRGICMGLRRLARCRPGGGSGYDPVP